MTGLRTLLRDSTYNVRTDAPTDRQRRKEGRCCTGRDVTGAFGTAARALLPLSLLKSRRVVNLRNSQRTSQSGETEWGAFLEALASPKHTTNSPGDLLTCRNALGYRTVVPHAEGWTFLLVRSFSTRPRTIVCEIRPSSVTIRTPPLVGSVPPPCWARACCTTQRL